MPKDSAGQDHAAAYEPLVPEDTVYTEGAPAEEEPVPSRTARRRERAVDTVPAEPEVMADTEKYQLTPVGRRRRIATIFHIARKYEVWNRITPVRLRCMLEELGPMFVKMGQILANRSEILPQRFCDELRRLRTEVDPVPYRVVLECLEAEYGHKLGEIFDAVDPNPLGSASLAQVHRARLVTGEDVAIKVQRPGAQQVMAQDIDIMRSLVRHISRFVKTDQFIDLHDVVEELWQSFREETNFLMEARNLDEFYAYHASTPGVSCPRSYLDLCTEHVVVMDYIEGISIAEPDELVAAGYELRDVGERIVDDYATQVLDHGFFHADPHAGNIILRDGVIYFIDLGMVGRMSSHDRRLVKDIVFAVAENDVPKLKDSLMRFAVTRGNNSEIDHTSFLSDLDFIVEDFGSLDLRDLDIGKFLTALINLARKNDVELPSVVTMFARGMVTLEGLLTEYLPDVNMVEIITAHSTSSARRAATPAPASWRAIWRAAPCGRPRARWRLPSTWGSRRVCSRAVSSSSTPRSSARRRFCGAWAPSWTACRCRWSSPASSSGRPWCTTRASSRSSSDPRHRLSRLPCGAGARAHARARDLAEQPRQAPVGAGATPGVAPRPRVRPAPPR